MTKPLHLGLPCPACGTAMHPSSLGCTCGVRVEGEIDVNEFAALSQEQLHFLRIFVMFEGRIREMEPALGISYPTVKARIAELKGHLKLDGTAEVEVSDVLTQLEAGDLNVEEALKRLT